MNPPPPIVPPSTRAGDEIEIGRKTSQAFSEANAAAVHWMNLSDAQAFTGTWLESGGILKDVISQDQWSAGMASTRQRLGPVHARVVSSHVITNNLPYGAQGNFMIIKYTTQFQRMPNAVETITLTREGSLGLWKVISYRIDTNR